MTTWGDALKFLTDRLSAAGIPSARLDAMAVFAHPERRLTAEQKAKLDSVARRRLKREPVARIIGRREFWSLDFAISPDTLDPRPDTETVVEAALAAIADRQASLSLLDFGTGSGCILLALLSELPHAHGVGVDISPAALVVARGNAERLGLADRAWFIAGDWGKGIDGAFDAIVANPPYIPDDEVSRLDADVADFDPLYALAGGADGLASYRAIAIDLERLLTPDGVAVLEVGWNQAAKVAAIMEGAGLAVSRVHRDLAGVERCLVMGRTWRLVR
jgi:release factor glutamine methyltransferase